MNDVSDSDAILVAELRAWIAAGESEELEFKVEFPRQANKFAREIAAFATSGDGHILIGVSDDGEIVGIPELANSPGRDLLKARIEGLCASVIKPLVQPRVRFCELDGVMVAIVSVPKGPEPIYYADNTPYLRQLTSSRPADPREVRDLVETWLRQQQSSSPEVSAEANYLAQLLQLLVSILVQTEDAMSRARSVDPWFSSMRRRLEVYASQARDFAARAPATLLGLEGELEVLAEHIDEVVHQNLGIGFGWEEVSAAIGKTRDATVAIKAKWLDEPLASSSPDALEGEVRVVARKLERIAQRAEATSRRAGGATELQEAAGEIGATVLRASWFGIGFGGDTERQALRQIGIDLRVLETNRLYMDGGASVREIVGGIRTASSALNALVGASPLADVVDEARLGDRGSAASIGGDR